MKQDLAEKIAQETAKKTAKAEAEAKKKIARLEKAAAKKTAAAEKKEEKQAANAEKRAAKAAAKVAAAEKKAAAKVAQANKKAAAQSEKAAKLAAKKRAKEAPAEDGEESDGGKKKKGGKKLLLLLPVVALAAAAAVFFFLRGRGGKAEEPLEPIAAPVEYAFGEDVKIPALPVWGEDVLVYQETIEAPRPESKKPEDGGGENAGTGEEGDAGAGGAAEEEEPATAIQYTYEGLQDAKGLTSAYAALLAAEDAGFSAVDEDLVRTDMPDFDGKAAEKGQEAEPPATAVHLARNGTGEEDVVHSLHLSWEEGRCKVIVDMPAGRVRDPQPPAQSMMPMAPGLTVEGFQAMSPSALGLPGESMDEYSVYVQDGTILVYGSTCIRLSVYSTDASGSPEIAGNYFLSADGQHLYKYDLENNSVEELEIED